MESWCAYQERSHLQVRRKLIQFGIDGNEAEELIASLITDGFLNEHRFAKAYAGGKFRMKKWGKARIERELRQQGVGQRCIADGLKEIDAADYRKTLRILLDKKLSQLKGDSEAVRKNKVARFAIGKGYESDLVWRMLGDPSDD